MSTTIWPPLWHKCPNINPHAQKRTDNFQKIFRFIIRAQKMHNSQRLPFPSWPLWAQCQGQTFAEQSRVATDCLQIAHTWPWSICKSFTPLFGVTSCVTARRASSGSAKARRLGSAALEGTVMPNHGPKSMPRHCWMGYHHHHNLKHPPLFPSSFQTTFKV